MDRQELKLEMVGDKFPYSKPFQKNRRFGEKQTDLDKDLDSYMLERTVEFVLTKTNEKMQVD